MRIAVAGGTGRVGVTVVNRLRDSGHEVIPMSPSGRVNALHREGLSDVLGGVTVLVDVTDPPTTEASAARWFLETSTFNLLEAGKAVGVQHYVVLSLVGVDRVDAGYFYAKRAQEARVRASGTPYTIVRCTQLYEFIADLVDDATDGRMVRVADVPVQPVAAADVARVIAHVALGAALNSVVEVAGPERLGLDELARRVLTARHDDREVVPAAYARYLGAELEPGDRSLLPDTVVTGTTVAQWLSEPT